MCWVLGCCCPATPAVAQAVSPAENDAAVVRPFVSETTFLVVKIDPQRVGPPDLMDSWASMSPGAQAATQPLSEWIVWKTEQLQSLVKDRPIYATAGIPISRTRVSTFIFVKGLSRTDAANALEASDQMFKSESCVHGDYAVTSPVHNLDVAKSIAASPASAREGIAEAFASVAGFPVQVLLLPPSYVRRTMEELSAHLPRQLGGGPSKVLTDGVQWAALGIDPKRLRAMVVVQSSSEQAASDLAAYLPKMLQAAYDAMPQIHKQIPNELAQGLLSWLDPQIAGAKITVRMDGLDKTSANLKMLAVLVRTIEEKQRRSTHVEQFKKILLGMHNYHDSHRSFPPADKFRAVDGKDHLSWRVHLLPFVGEGRLFTEFHLDEPWDSPHNRKLITKMPDVFKSHSLDPLPKVDTKPGHTTFLAPVGEGTIFGGAESTPIRDIYDGTSNTVAVVEVKPEKAVPWTAPRDYAFDPEDPAEGLLFGSDGRWLCAFADGSVHKLRGDISKETFLHLFQMSDRHVINYREIR